VAQLVEALRYKAEGRGFDSRWWHCNLLTQSFGPHYSPGVDSASNRYEYQEYFLGVKAWHPNSSEAVRQLICSLLYFFPGLPNCRSPCSSFLLLSPATQPYRNHKRVTKRTAHFYQYVRYQWLLKRWKNIMACFGNHSQFVLSYGLTAHWLLFVPSGSTLTVPQFAPQCINVLHHSYTQQTATTNRSFYCHEVLTDNSMIPLPSDGAVQEWYEHLF